LTEYIILFNLECSRCRKHLSSRDIVAIANRYGIWYRIFKYNIYALTIQKRAAMSNRYVLGCRSRECLR